MSNKNCKHKWIELVEGLTHVCSICGTVNVDGHYHNRKNSLDILITYATVNKRSIYGDLYEKTMGVKLKESRKKEDEKA